MLWSHSASRSGSARVDSRLVWLTPEAYRRLQVFARKHGVSMSRALDMFADSLPKRSN